MADEHDSITGGIEEWRAIPGYEGRYEASSLGRVRSLERRCKSPRGERTVPGKVLKPCKTRGGYLLLSLLMDGTVHRMTVHRAVCEAFHGRPDVKMAAAHGDGDTSNNRPENLRWATWTENSADMLDHGTRPMGEGHPLARLTEDDVRYIRASDESRQQMAARYSVGLSAIDKIRKRRTWRHVE